MPEEFFRFAAALLEKQGVNETTVSYQNQKIRVRKTAGGVAIVHDKK